MATIYWIGRGGSIKSPVSGMFSDVSDTSGDWSSGIPGGYDSVILPGGSYSVTIDLYTVNQTFAVGSLTVDFGASFINDFGGRTTVNGDLNNTGSITVSLASHLIIESNEINDTDPFQHNSTNTGTISIFSEDGLYSSSVEFTGNLNNYGVINVGDDSFLNFYSVSASVATLAAGGQVVLSGGTISQIDDTGNINGYTHDVLHNRDDTIDGYGHLSAGDFVNDAGGTIDGNSSSGSLVIDGSANLTNNGLIEASDDTGTGDSGSLIIDDVVTNNAQITAIETGIVTIAGSVNGGTIHSSNAGSIVISGQVNGAALDLSSAEASLVISGIVKGGSLQTENGAAITAAGGALDGAGAQVYSSAAIFIETDQSLTIKGTLDETGTITLGGTGQQAALLAGSATTTLTGGGQILLADGGANVIDATIRNDV